MELHAKFGSPRPYDLEPEDFLMFSIYKPKGYNLKKKKKKKGPLNKATCQI